MLHWEEKNQFQITGEENLKINMIIKIYLHLLYNNKILFLHS